MSGMARSSIWGSAGVMRRALTSIDEHVRMVTARSVRIDSTCRLFNQSTSPHAHKFLRLLKRMFRVVTNIYKTDMVAQVGGHSGAKGWVRCHRLL